MKQRILLSILSFVVATSLMAQTKVAQYSAGKRGTDKYENFGFWTKDGKRTEISYAYGKSRKEVKLQYIGKYQMNGQTAFKVRFTNNYILYIIPEGLKLQIKDGTGKYNKTFSWEYEGPVNGIGTYCEVCAEGDEEAMDLIRKAYLK
jgi:hypothetical protein